ncbi:PEP-CTERM sorting domain-containing protein [Motiliproteus coralliicola]|uniref:PEP-CTERM sorting domain-containing protein n=1 Tax=Motiliproteus coralliicola TaxID=2283196 RepID=A0A369WSZ6_9GAMM|nr:PEP-CTERM sorting domain-containing protein [Motiliproteus coralliicola]RDE25218.1 PEP-CTERM sorting domain-containing protein [Motiliproteus coralliicola]
MDKARFLLAVIALSSTAVHAVPVTYSTTGATITYDGETGSYEYSSGVAEFDAAYNAAGVAPVLKANGEPTTTSNSDLNDYVNVFGASSSMFKITRITDLGDRNISGDEKTVFSGAITSTSTVGEIIDPQSSGDPESPGTVMDNLGDWNDGLLNGELITKGQTSYYFDPLMFITADQLNDKGTGVDPGYIRLGGAETDGNSIDIEYSTIGSGSDSISIGELLNITFSCTDSDCGTGTWAIDVFPEALQVGGDLLGEDAFFDHLDFLVKAGNGWGVIDFDFNILASGLDGILFTDDDLIEFDVPYLIEGTFDTKSTGFGSGISGISIWARDPDASTDIPNPGTLLLLGIGLAALRTSVARRSKR